MHTFRLAPIFRERASCPSPPACGGRGRDPARRQPQARGLDPRGREGEVGGAAARNGGDPPPHPDPLRPQGRRGGYFGHLPGCEICACPSAQAGVQGPLDSRFRGNDGKRVSLWIAAERLPQFRALWPEAKLDPAITAPDEYAAREWSREEALTEILRGRLEGLGPTTTAALAAPLGFDVEDIA